MSAMKGFSQVFPRLYTQVNLVLYYRAILKDKKKKYVDETVAVKTLKGKRSLIVSLNYQNVPHQACSVKVISDIFLMRFRSWQDLITQM